MAKTKAKNIDKKSKKKVYITLGVVALAILFAVLFVVFAFFGKDEVETFSFSGYVFADGECLEGAKVSCGVKQTQTDENGYYSFDGLTSVVEVSVSKDNYIFGKGLVYVNCDKENVDFFGYELFSRIGVVKNGENVVPYATIIAESETGTFITQAGPLGTFSLTGLAGDVHITSYTSEGNLDFFEVNFNKTQQDNLVINTTTHIDVSVLCDSDEGHDFVLSLDGNNLNLDSDLKCSIDDVSPQSVLTLSSTNYYIANPQIRVTIQNGEYVFNVEKYYDIQGVVLSGSTPLDGARVLAGGVRADVNDDGSFAISNLHGENVVKAYCRGFTFEDVNINNTSTTVSLNGSFSLSGKVVIDNGELRGFVVASGENTARTDINGEFTLSNLKLGDVLRVNTSDYHVVNGDITLSKIISPTFELKKIYTATINIEYLGTPIDGAVAKIGDDTYTSSNGVITIPNLFGYNAFTLECEGYKFEGDYALNFRNNTLGKDDITIYKYFTLSGAVTSGDMKINDGTVNAGGYTVNTDEDGHFEITGLYTSGKMTISADGYNTQTLDYSINNNEKNITLDYDVVGSIASGDIAVDGVKISCGDNTTYSADGQFSLRGLVGRNTISFAKEYYTFANNDIQVSSCKDLEISCTYKVSGVASNEQGAISGVVITITKDGESATATTNSEGKFEFTGLYGKYMLYCSSDYSEQTLLPYKYDITAGGIYNFSESGYKISGKVTSAGVSVAGVTVTAGEISTVTNKDGEYTFDLLIKEETLVLSKDGYTFANNNFNVDKSLEGTSVDFECTYAIDGVVKSGETPLEGVKITIAGNDYYTDDDGCYAITGLAGSNNMQVSLDSYSFDNPSNIVISGTYNINATFDSTITITTGDVPVVGAKFIFDDKEYITSSEGCALINGLSLGDTIAFALTGYTISPYTFDSLESSVDISATYTIAGTVYLNNSTLEGVTVTCGDRVVITNDQGIFSFSGVAGLVSLSFEKTGTSLSFEGMNITGYTSNLVVKARYTVSGQITCAGIGVGGVNILAIPKSGGGGSVSSTTDPSGNYSILLDYSAILQLQKTGYEFNDEYEIDGPTTMNIVAQYQIKGRVISGDLKIKGATVLLSDGTTATTDKNGEFTFEHIEEGVSFSVTADGFNDGKYEMIFGYSDSIVIELTYNVTIKLSEITSLPSVTLKVGEDETTMNIISEKILENLKGSLLIEITKDGYTFSPEKFAVGGGTTQTIIVKKQFDVSGYITTTNGIVATGVTITAGEDKSCVTDSNGYYHISGLTDNPVIKLEMNVVDTAYNGDNYSYSKTLFTASTDRENANFTLPDSDYAYFLFKNGYQKLNDASSYQIFGSGTVVDSTTGKDQYVHIVYKKDTKGNRLIQNLNYGDTINAVVIKVDPKVAQLTYVDTANESVKYQTITGSDVKNGTANWSTSWTNTTYASYLENYGVNAEGYYPYVINQDTVSSIENISLSNGMYTFTLKLAMTKTMYNYYTIQMSKMCSQQEFASFTYCYLTYTIGQDGFIRTMVVDEVYQVSAANGLVTPTITDKFTYTFKTTSMDDVINDIKIDTVDNIKTSLLEETPTKATKNINIAYCKMENSEYNIYSDKRRKFL